VEIDLPNLHAHTQWPDGNRVHRDAYLLLRAAVHAHYESGNEPRLSLCPRMYGGYESAQSGDSRLGQLIRENYDYVERMRRQEAANAAEQSDLDDADEEVVSDEIDLENSDMHQGWDNEGDLDILYEGFPEEQ
jgi:hypothetical protein